jgi:uncharacterized Zn-binding protein involved in type VI secretion
LGKPAARIGDSHSCPMVTPGGVPHVGGPIIGGCQTVLIEGKPAATAGDACFCNGGHLDKIKLGSRGVFIGGKPAARQWDPCEHGGVIIGGSGTVLIGEVIGEAFSKEGDEEDEKDKFIQPSEEEKVIIINQAIQECIVLLEKKLALMERDDPEMLDAFKKWFGRNDEEAKLIILERIRRALEVSRTLTVENFYYLDNIQKKEKTYGLVYGKDKGHNIYLGDKFWKAGLTNNTKAGVLIHELSHFKDIGKTDDITYGVRGCVDLAEHYPREALINADSFQYFIEEQNERLLAL